MARTRRALAAPSSRGWRLSTASRTFRVLHRLTVILSLRRIRDPSARGHEVRILRLRSQARFAQDDTALRDRGRPGAGLAGVAKREDSYGRMGGPKAGSRASSPGEQAAACDCQRTRELGFTRDKLGNFRGDGPRYGEAEGTFFWDEPDQAGGGEDQEPVRFVADDQL